MQFIHRLAFGSGAARLVLVCGLLACGVARQAAASSILLDPPSGWNGLAISGRVVAGWRENGGAGVASSEATGFLLAGPTDPPLVPGQVLEGAPLNLVALPATGSPKDKAEVNLSYKVVVGTLAADSSDKFLFDIDATTSAMTAFYDFGGGPVAADAFVTVEVEMMSAAPVPASTLASMALPTLPALTAGAPHVESLAATAEIGPFGAPTSTWTMGPGDAGFSIPFVLEDVSDMFVYRLRYELLTPFGSDPTVSLSLEGNTARVVPEPSAWIMIGCAATAWGLRRPTRMPG